MKRHYWITLAVVLLLIVGLVGCSSGTGVEENGASEGDTNGAAEADTNGSTVHRLIIAGSPPGGTSYILMGGLAKIIDEHVENVYASVQATTGSVENARLVAEGECNIGTSFFHSAQLAYEGKEPFNEPKDSIRIMAAGIPPVAHFVVKKDSGIESFADIKGKRVAVGAPGSAMAQTVVPTLLEFYGLTMDDIDAKYIAPNEAADALIDGVIDVAGVLAAPPAAAVTQIATSVDIKPIKFNKEDLDKLQEAYPYMAGFNIKGGTYDGIAEDYMTPCMPDGMTVNKDVPEDVVYRILKALHEHQDEWIAVHPGAANWIPERLVEVYEPIKEFLPLHPGAERYLKEEGYIN
jgi:TRAP transporter TAXI family solute receptor